MLQSGVYTGQVRHRRFSPVFHEFSYTLSMMALDLDEINEVSRQHWLFGTQWFNPVRFKSNDYVTEPVPDLAPDSVPDLAPDSLAEQSNGSSDKKMNEPSNLKSRIKTKVKQLGGNWCGEKIIMVAQCRSFGLYFSPVNFYYCYQTDGQCQYMLAEVSNTPWHETHHYLVDMNCDELTPKTFHVSPFMQMDMQYKWQVKPPKLAGLETRLEKADRGKTSSNEHKLFVHIENLPNTNQSVKDKTFDATMALVKQPITNFNLIKTWFSLPFMTLKIVSCIYWQALKLFIKKVPFVPYSKIK